MVPGRLHMKWLALTLLFCVSGCAATNGTSACPAWVEPLGWSSKDTEPTQRDIFTHNAKYELNCLGT